jgi:hypothetical protein
MCTLALFALVIAAVLISRRLAQLVGAAVIILLARSWPSPRSGDRCRCRRSAPGARRAIRAARPAAPARLARPRAAAVPKVGAGCPAGFSVSPTSGYCVESGC